MGSDQGPVSVIVLRGRRLRALALDAGERARLGAAGKARAETLVRETDFAVATRRAFERALAPAEVR